MAYRQISDRWYGQKGFLVDAETDLTDLPACEPGSVAHTAGFTDAWEKAIDGTWTEVTQSGIVALAVV